MMNENNCTIVIPAYNEEKTVRKVVKTALQTEGVSEVVVVNDGSIDNTRKNIADLPIKIVNHAKNQGYTKAMHHGIKAAKGPIVAVIDADWKNITPEAIRKIIQPVIGGEAELVKASFNRARGRVTEFAVKPMMRILFPDLEMNQPISGQFAGHKSFLENIEVGNSWGIAIGILIEAINAGLRVMEVDVGELVHKKRSDQDVAEMAKEVLETLIGRAGLTHHKYKMVVFTFDRTLIQEKTLSWVYSKLQISGEMNKLQNDLESKRINYHKYIEKVAKLYKGKSVEDVGNTIQRAPLMPYAKQVIGSLKKRRFEVALVSSSFSPIVLPIAKELGIERVDCNYFEIKDGCYTGCITSASLKKWSALHLDEAIKKAFQRTIALAKIKSNETIMVINNPGWLDVMDGAGLSVAYKPQSKELRDRADKTINVLAEILALVE